MEPEGTSISVSACKDLSQWGGLSSCRESRLLPEDAGIPKRYEVIRKLRVNIFKMFKLILLKFIKLTFVLKGLACKSPLYNIIVFMTYITNNILTKLLHCIFKIFL